MATTHVFMGMAVAAAVGSTVAPEYLVPALVAGALGGLFPDFDVAFAHRKTLHFPTGYVLGLVPTTLVASLWPTWWTISLAIGIAAAAVHSISDIFGNGNEYDPWNATSQEAVYNHVLGRWHRPRYVIRYDGSPEDLFLCMAVSVPVYAVAPAMVRPWILLGLLISVVYTVGRKPIGAWAERHGL